MGEALDQGIGHRRGLAEGAGGFDHQHAVHARVREQQIQGLPVGGGAGLIAEVHRVGLGARFDERFQSLLGRFGKLRQSAAESIERVGRQQAHAGTVAQDGQAVVADPPGRFEHLDHLQQFIAVFHPQQAGAAERGGVHCIGRLFGVTAGFQHDDRLDARGAAGRRQKLARIADLLQVQQDRPGVRVSGQIVQDIGQIDIDTVAQVDQMTEAEAVVIADVQCGLTDGAGFGDERDLTGEQRLTVQTDVEVVERDVKSLGAGSQHPQQIRLGGVQNRLKQRLALGLRQAARFADQHRGARAAFAQLPDQRRHLPERPGDDRQRRAERQAGDVAVGERPRQRPAFGGHRHDRSLKITAHQVVRDDGLTVAVVVAVTVTANQGDGVRLEQGVEIANRHGMKELKRAFLKGGSD